MTKQLSLKVGSTITVLAPSRETRHIRAIADEIVLYRVWSGGGWEHDRESIEVLQKLYDDGHLKIKNGGKNRNVKPKRFKKRHKK